MTPQLFRFVDAIIPVASVLFFTVLVIRNGYNFYTEQKSDIFVIWSVWILVICIAWIDLSYKFGGCK